MEDEQPPALFQSTTETTRGPYWSLAIPVVIVIAVATFFISLTMIGSDPAAGALNGLSTIFAGIFAVGAFLGTILIVVIVRLLKH